MKLFGRRLRRGSLAKTTWELPKRRARRIARFFALLVSFFSTETDPRRSIATRCGPSTRSAILPTNHLKNGHFSFFLLQEGRGGWLSRRGNCREDALAGLPASSLTSSLSSPNRNRPIPLDRDPLWPKYKIRNIAHKSS